MSPTRPHTSRLALRLTAELDRSWEVTVAYVVDGTERHELWEVYRDSFEVLRTRAAQRHLMTRDEFDEMMADRRIDKIVIRDRAGEHAVAGLACLSHDLAAVPLVSPDFYRARWPRECEEDRLWYITFLAVAPDYQGSSVMGAMISYLTQQAGREGAVIAGDFCEYNEQEVGITSALTRLARSFNPGTTRTWLDTQQYWAFEIPRVTPS
jgi:GNAT superfamily N-acetyltransferase